MKRIAVPRLLKVASFRFAALYVAFFAISAVILAAAVFVEARSALREQMRGRIETEAFFLGEEFKADGLDHLTKIVLARGRGATALDYLLQSPAGAHLAGEVPAQPGLTPGWRTIDVPQASEDGGRPERVRALVTDLGGGVLLAVGSDLHQIGDLEEAIVTAFLWAVGLAAVLGTTGGLLLSRAFLRRVDAISRTAEAIIEGDLSRRIPTHGTGDDLDHLAATLNRMLDRIGVLMDSLRQVSSDVAHDLRTPLTRLYQRLEDARMHASTTADHEAAIEGAIVEAQGLLGTFSAVLRIAQVEGAASREGFADIDLSALAETVADAYRPDAEDAGYRLVTSIGASIVVRGDRELLTQALANLLENALRHTPSGSRIEIRTAGNGRTGAWLAVGDNGPGVAEADLNRLTERFYRGERSRTMPGNGLGLSLVGAVAELHGAKLRLEQLNPGFRVSICFPPLSVKQHAAVPSEGIPP